MSDGFCEVHCGTVKNAEGRFVCCDQEEFAVFPQTPPEPRFNPPPANFAELVEAARNPKETGE